MRMIVYKGFQIKPDQQNPHSWIVVTDGKGGKIPKVLEGHFTAPKVAINYIDGYLESKTVAVK